MHQLLILWALAAFFFGNNSLLPKELSTLITSIKQHCITFEAMQISDNQVFTKLGCQIDTRIFRWLQQCESTDDREVVDDSTINFQPIVSQILNAQFIQTLPPIFKTKNDNAHDEDNNNDRKSKKKKLNQDASRHIKNAGPIQQWIAASAEDYQIYFSGKHLELRPRFKG